MKLCFTRRATQDLVGLPTTSAPAIPAGALRVRGAILESLQNLVAWPEIGRPQTEEGVRKLVTRKYPYLIYYKIDAAADEIVVLTIQHPARQRQYEDA